MFTQTVTIRITMGTFVKPSFHTVKIAFGHVIRFIVRLLKTIASISSQNLIVNEMASATDNWGTVVIYGISAAKAHVGSKRNWWWITYVIFTVFTHPWLSVTSVTGSTVNDTIGMYKNLRLRMYKWTNLNEKYSRPPHHLIIKTSDISLKKVLRNAITSQTIFYAFSVRNNLLRMRNRISMATMFRTTSVTMVAQP